MYFCIVSLVWFNCVVFYRYKIWVRKSLYIFFVVRARVSRGGVRSIEGLRYTNVGDGKLGWGSFLVKSEQLCLWSETFNLRRVLNETRNGVSANEPTELADDTNREWLAMVIEMLELQVYISWAVRQRSRSCKVLMIITCFARNI